MSQYGVVIVLMLAVMAVLRFWRYLLLLFLSLVMAVFCLGLYHIVQVLHHG
jgi:hypothetical protein